MMEHFKYAVLPPATWGGARRAFLFEIVPFTKGHNGYAGQCIQHTVWMKELSQ